MATFIFGYLKGILFFWKNLIKSKDWIMRGLYWHPGSGHSVFLGRDHILGLRDASFLTPPLIEHLHTKNIWYPRSNTFDDSSWHMAFHHFAQPQRWTSYNMEHLLHGFITCGSTLKWHGWSFTMVRGRSFQKDYYTKCLHRDYKFDLAI